MLPGIFNAAAESREGLGWRGPEARMKARRQTQPSQLRTQRHGTGASRRHFPLGTFTGQLARPWVWQVFGNSRGAAGALWWGTSSSHASHLPSAATTSARGQTHLTGPRACGGGEEQFFLHSNISANKGEPEHTYFQLLILQLSHLRY